MSQQNKKTLSVVFILAIFVFTAIIFSQAKEVNAAITMREYVDMRVAEQQRAVDKALESLNERLAGMNEFRASIDDTNKLFATKETVDKMQVDVRELRSFADEAKGKASQFSVLFAMGIAILSLAIQIARVLSDRKKIGG